MCHLSCDSAKPAKAPPLTDLANARLDLAKEVASRHAPDEALALLVSTIQTDPSNDEARALAAEILAKTRWRFPLITLDHHLPIEHIRFDSAKTLCASISSDSQTLVKWNLQSLEVENVLFPVKAAATRSMVFDPTYQFAVIERAGTALLCDAQSLKPIRNLGPLPSLLTPASVIVFSADGLLLAHPTFVSATETSIIWHLRDTKTGEILRSSESATPDKPVPLTAILDRTSLRVLYADGALLEMPVSPVEPVKITAPEKPISLRQAQFSDDGSAALILTEQSPHQPPKIFCMAIGESEAIAPDLTSLLGKSPWSQQPNIWNGLLRDENENLPIKVDGASITFPALPYPALRVDSDITAVTLNNDRLIIGEANGRVTIFLTLPFPAIVEKPPKPEAMNTAGITAFANLSKLLAGCEIHPQTRKLINLSPADRLTAFAACDFKALSRVFPNLDFSPVIAALKDVQHREAKPESLIPLWDRLARADTSRKSWPDLLEKSAHLSTTQWHQDLSKSLNQPAPLEIEDIFANGDSETIKTAIQNLAETGPQVAKALELSLASNHPEWIAACLEKVKNLPPFLRQLALSRLAWLEDRKADALSMWPEVFPELAEVRLREDWDGWEQADFTSAYQEIHRAMSEQLALIELPENSTAEQRKEVADRFSDPKTFKAIGRMRFAKASLKAAFAFSAFKEEKETTFKLAALARELGEAPEPCLRAEAMALTALGDFVQAHQRWILLITEHPLHTQQPGDYAEAAYTAFENANPQQAMAILTTGLHRFPNDANFALRAGWVSLLTGNADRAYRFLLSGRQIGFPKEKLENATALLAIAAAQSGATEDAAAFYQDLIDIDADWKNPDTLESLEWPEELKSSLRELVP